MQHGRRKQTKYCTVIEESSAGRYQTFSLNDSTLDDLGGHGNLFKDKNPTEDDVDVNFKDGGGASGGNVSLIPFIQQFVTHETKPHQNLNQSFKS